MLLSIIIREHCSPILSRIIFLATYTGLVNTQNFFRVTYQIFLLSLSPRFQSCRRADTHLWNTSLLRSFFFLCLFSLILSALGAPVTTS